MHADALSALPCTQVPSRGNRAPLDGVGQQVIDDLLRRQDGVITHAQARRAGLLQDAINRRVKSGRWRRCARGVYFADDRPFTDAARIRTEVWSYGPYATACELAAAWWHGLVQTAPNHVAVDIVLRRNLRVTAIPLTVLEAAVTHGGVPIMDTALQRGVTLMQLRQTHARNARRHGASQASALLRSASGGARSEAERLLIRLLRAAAVTGWKANYPVGNYLVDIAFPAQKVAIEIDGWAFHSDHDVFQRDRRRQNRLALDGWQVLRFTWLDLTQRPQRVLAEIRSAIRAP